MVDVEGMAVISLLGACHLDTFLRARSTAGIRSFNGPTLIGYRFFFR